MYQQFFNSHCSQYSFFYYFQNQQPGAEEAFKILGHAIELIGEPVSRMGTLGSLKEIC